MKGTISDEIEVNVPANVAWELYGTLHLSRFIVQELPTLLQKVDVVEGDGSTGSVLKITFPEAKITLVTDYKPDLPCLLELEASPKPSTMVTLLHRQDSFLIVEGTSRPLHDYWITSSASGTPGIPYFKERFNIVDDEKRYKQSQVIEGGYVDLGYTFYGIKFEVNEKDDNSCITKFTVSYEVEDVKLASHAFTMVEPLQTVIRSAKTYLTNKTHN